MNKTFTIVIFLTFFCNIAYGFEVSGLSTPESFIQDPGTGHYYISNINGLPADVDNNGFITLLDKNGVISKLKFAESGLNAPKGLAIKGNTIYTADIDKIKGFDKITGEKTFEADLSKANAGFLNDLAVFQNELYASDMSRNKIFKINPDSGEYSVFIDDPTLNGPNGIVFDKNGTLFIASWNSGFIFRIENKKVTKLQIRSLKNLDGIAFDNNENMYVSDFTGGLIYKIDKNNVVETIKDNLKNPPDIGIDLKNNLLLIPSFTGNSAQSIELKK